MIDAIHDRALRIFAAIDAANRAALTREGTPEGERRFATRILSRNRAGWAQYCAAHSLPVDG